ncbi:MAG TPA: bifunctional phosphopantothenoylcysteine decarboxylase/phosphopantothenate synthase [Novosphingobium sp.]|nr:bifunctional phosphopantothenoylcysteine decarboxylase/phosphopantothenate synthase [Novosphingobium sp.]
MHKRLEMSSPRILLIVGGGIAAYKACELVRLIRKGGGEVTCVLTGGGEKFVTAMTLAALSENPVHTTLWDLKNEAEMGHIQLSRAADLVVVCPATADLLAKMAAGIADDLATTLLLATDKPVLAVPAMNVRMWEHPATRRNVETLMADGVAVLDPDEGPMACGEFGAGRLPEPQAIWAAIGQLLALDQLDATAPETVEGEGLGGLSGSLIPRSTPIAPPAEEPEIDDEALMALPLPEEEPVPVVDLAGPLLSKKGKAKAAPPTDLAALNHTLSDRADAPEGALLEADPLAGQPDFVEEPAHRPLFGKHVLVTAGPTYEAIDPVRFIANRSSGRQGFAIAAAAAAAGARVTLVSGPVALPTPPGVDRIDIESAREMAAAVKKALPADVAVMVAAVADWRTMDEASEKLKKRGSAPPALRLTENPDILATVASGPKRPKLVIGFAAETEKMLEHAKEKRSRKGADWIIANDVSGPPGKGVMGGATNTVHIVSAEGVESLPEMPKEEVGRALVERIALALAT